MPETELSAFSSDGASATAWTRARVHLEAAEVFWLSSARMDARTSLPSWRSGWTMRCTSAPSPSARKAKNLDRNPHCILTTGRNSLDGLDVVIEGEAGEVSDKAERGRVAAVYAV